MPKPIVDRPDVRVYREVCQRQRTSSIGVHVRVIAFGEHAPGLDVRQYLTTEQHTGWGGKGIQLTMEEWNMLLAHAAEITLAFGEATAAWEAQVTKKRKGR